LGGAGFAFPTAAVDRDDRLHVIWAESPTWHVGMRSMEWALSQWASLWSATYTARNGWSAARQFYDGQVSWNPRASTGLVRDHAGRLYFAFAPITYGDPGVVIAQLGTTWQFQTLPVSAAPAYISIAPSSQRVLLAIVATDQSVKHDENSVFVSVSKDYGKTFEPFKLVARANGDPAHDLDALASPDGIFHLIWKVARRDGTQLVRHIQSIDGGETWGGVSDLPLTSNYNTLSSAIDGNGCVHVIVETWKDNERGHLEYAHWSDKWSVREKLFGAVASAGPVLGVNEKGNVVLIFAHLPAHSEASAAPMSMYSVIERRR